jgi:hypothetical protein
VSTPTSTTDPRSTGTTEPTSTTDPRSTGPSEPTSIGLPASEPTSTAAGTSLIAPAWGNESTPPSASVTSSTSLAPLPSLASPASALPSRSSPSSAASRSTRDETLPSSTDHGVHASSPQPALSSVATTDQQLLERRPDANNHLRTATGPDRAAALAPMLTEVSADAALHH